MTSSHTDSCQTRPFDDDLHKECGVFGIAGAVSLVSLSLQRRGQEARCIVTRYRQLLCACE